MNSDSSIASTDRRSRRMEARRREILRAAAVVFRERGYSEAGMRDIAEAADLSSGNLYYYFKGKHEILYFCQTQALDQMLVSLQQVQQQGGDVAPRLYVLIQAHLHCMLGDIEGSVAHITVTGLPPELRDRLIVKRNRYEQGIRQLVAKGVDRGEFVPLDSALVTRAILGACNWTVQWYHPEGSQSVTKIADNLADYLIRGLTTGLNPPPDNNRTAGQGDND